VQRLSGARLRQRSLHLAKERPVELNFVLGDVNNDDAKGQLLEVVLEFESLIDRDEDIESVLKERNKLVILKPMPIEIESSCDLMAWERFCDSRIDASV